MDHDKIRSIQNSPSDHEESSSSSGGVSNGDWEVLEWVNNCGVIYSAHPVPQISTMPSIPPTSTIPTTSSSLNYNTCLTKGDQDMLSSMLNVVVNKMNHDLTLSSSRSTFNELSSGGLPDISINPPRSTFAEVIAGNNQDMMFMSNRSIFSDIKSASKVEQPSPIGRPLFGDGPITNNKATGLDVTRPSFGNLGVDEFNLKISCPKCAKPTVNCLNCNEFMCSDCLVEHLKINRPHRFVYFQPPIGSPSKQISNDRCDLHKKNISVVCNCCKKLICEDCFMEAHRGHLVVPITNASEHASTRVVRVMDKMNEDIKAVKGSIDDSLKMKREMEHNYIEVKENIQKSFRQLVIQIEERERQLLEEAERIKSRKLVALDDQMAGLKSVLSGLWQTNSMLNRVTAETMYSDGIDIISGIMEVERQLEQLETTYMDLQPKEEHLIFYPPDIRLLDKYGLRGEVVLQNGDGAVVEKFGLGVDRQMVLRDGAFCLPTSSPPELSWTKYAHHSSNSNSPNSHASDEGAKNFPSTIGTKFNYIPGAVKDVTMKNVNTFRSFGPEGHGDGEVSRAWGICTDRFGRILVSDRRNNRVQVFDRDGTFKFSFGRKGTGDGHFELPAGICVDVDDRIIVVDKDNHRVQIFTFAGIFLLKFGGFGRDPGQFQYPWDVAVNTRRQIVVADSRNHRIQQFDSEGRFIRKIVLDNFSINKLPASPRGVCFTPEGHVIVSDFDNHCLYRVNLEENRILVAVGREGSRLDPIEFNRPSGVCCDDLGQIVVADSKNQRIVILCQNMRHLWHVTIAQPIKEDINQGVVSEKDRICYVNVMPDGHIVFLSESSPDCKDGSNPRKKFIHIL